MPHKLPFPSCNLYLHFRLFSRYCELKSSTESHEGDVELIGLFIANYLKAD